MKKCYPKLDGGTTPTASSTTTTTPRGRSSRACRSRTAALGAALQAAMPRLDQAGLPGVERRRRPSRREPPGDPGPVAAADREERGRVNADDHVVGLRAERRPVVRRSLQEEQPAARSHAAACKKTKTAVAGQDPGRQERRDHEPGDQVARLTEAQPAAEQVRADPPLAGGRPALRRPARRQRRRPRRRTR